MGPTEYQCPARGRPRSVLTMGLDLQRKAHPWPAGPLLRRLPWSTLPQGCKAVRGPAEGRGSLAAGRRPRGGGHLLRDGSPQGRVGAPEPSQGLARRWGRGRRVPNRPVPSRAPPARPPHLAAAWSASRQSRPLAQDVSHIRISASVGSRARPYHSARGGSSVVASFCSALGPPCPCGLPPPHAVGLSRGRRWQTARGAAPGRRGAGAGWANPPTDAGGTSPVTSAGGYKREARRGTPAAQAAPAVERRDARRGPGTGTHAADPSSLHPQGHFATVASPLTFGLRVPGRHDVSGLRRRLRGAVLPLQQRFPGRGQPHLLPLPGGLILEYGLACQPAGELLSVPAVLLAGAGQERSGGDGTGAGGTGLAVSAEEVRPGTGMGNGPGAEAGPSGGAVARAALCGGCVKRLH